jgi:hypothetical protein
MHMRQNVWKFLYCVPYCVEKHCGKQQQKFSRYHRMNIGLSIFDQYHTLVASIVTLATIILLPSSIMDAANYFLN